MNNKPNKILLLGLVLSVSFLAGCGSKPGKKEETPLRVDTPISKAVVPQQVTNTQAQNYLSYQPNCRDQGLIQKNECDQCARVPDSVCSVATRSADGFQCYECVTKQEEC
ncbi:MAG: hypothetical protein KAR31_13165, partial [Candidatus Omnitrophica bacterium]|nr:hypothetical protein [Candidatus Omnitrophota bacterium]